VESTQDKTEPIKVVVRYTNGRLIKGFTYDFFPNKDRFHVTPADHMLGKPIEVVVHDLKAVFVVRDFVGNPHHVERKTYSKEGIPYGVPLEITFTDAEVMVGSSMGFDPKRSGFFISPVDPMSNNLRVFVVSSAVKRIRQLHVQSGLYFEIPLSGRRPRARTGGTNPR
jgi:hypothetical protein